MNKVFSDLLLTNLVCFCFRATLLLVPLLGLNFLLTPFRPEQNHPWEHAYEVVSAVTASLQVCVSELISSYIIYLTKPTLNEIKVLSPGTPAS